MLQKHMPKNINDKIDELISLIYENMEVIGLDECSALEKELKEISQMFDE